MSSPPTDQPRGRRWPAWAAGGLIVGGFCALALSGLGWGIPSRRRGDLEGAAGVANLMRYLPRPLIEGLVDNSWQWRPSRGREPELPEGIDPDLVARLHRNLFNSIRSYHPDEYQLIKSLSHMNPRRLQFDPGNYIYPTLHTYLVGGAIGACSALGLVRLQRDLAFYFDHPEQMGRMYLIGRVLSLLAAVGTLLLVWRIGERMQRGVGLLALALLAAMPALGIHSHHMTRDTCGALAAVLLFACCRKLVETGAGRWYDLAGAAAGLCVGFQYFAILLWGMVPIAAALRRRRERAGDCGLRIADCGSGRAPDGRHVEAAQSEIRNPQSEMRKMVGRLAASLLVTLAIFGLACPYQVLNLSQFLADFSSETTHVGSGGVLERLVSFGWATHLFRMMPALVTWPMAVAVCAGIVLALARRRDDDVLLLVWLAVWAGVVGFDGRSYSRYYVPLLPALAFFAARGLAWARDCGLRIADFGLGRRAGSRLDGRQSAIRNPQSAIWANRRLRLAIAALVLAVVLGPAAAMSWAWARLYARENVRTVAGAWIASSDGLPAGSSIGMTKWPWQFEMPPLNWTRYRMVVLADAPGHSPYDWPRLMQLKPEYFVTSSLQYGNLELAKMPSVLELRGAPRAEAFWELVLKSDAIYQPLKTFEVPLTLLGRRIAMRGYPEDMQYVNPRIHVLKVPEATEVQAGGPRQDGPTAQERRRWRARAGAGARLEATGPENGT